MPPAPQLKDVCVWDAGIHEYVRLHDKKRIKVADGIKVASIWH